ncbi:unnamed protein product [Rangifer tarandus platyrhynchus]|uniref:Uncharacterized protein n=1 Tax=Rangifer tarandus platyrhynchus TaxID=3082113 RepID=A0AC59YTT6_RANTA
MAAKALCNTLISKWSSGSSFQRFGGTVVMRIFTVASEELISKPVSLVSMVKPSEGSSALRLSTTLFPSAATASNVGKIFRITTRSATLCPVVIVPFLYDPTCQTSSICTSNVPGATIKLLITLFIFVTRERIEACSAELGARS